MVNYLMLLHLLENNDSSNLGVAKRLRNLTACCVGFEDGILKVRQPRLLRLALVEFPDISGEPHCGIPRGLSTNKFLGNNPA